MVQCCEDDDALSFTIDQEADDVRVILASIKILLLLYKTRDPNGKAQKD